MKIGVIGAGTMGQGIAKAFAQVEGNTVALCDIKQEWAENGLAKIKKGYEKLVAKGKMTQEKADAIVAAITPGLKEDLCADCDLVVEAAFEDMKVKQTTFGELDKICKPECIFASNTSSLSITEIGKGVSRPLVGMHFFNPAPLMKLVEVVSGLATDRQVAEIIYDTSAAWGKTPVHAKSTPGFIVNRVARPYYAESLRLAGEGAADIATLDAILREAGSFRMGPFELMDMIGHDVNFAVTKSVWNAFYNDQRFLPSLMQQDLVDAGFLGRKTGRGFYDYAEGAEKPQPQTAAAVAAPANIVLHGDCPLAQALASRLQQAGVAFTQQPAQADGRVAQIGDTVLCLTDGRTATQRAHALGCNNLVLVDLALDYTKATRLAIAAALQADAAATEAVTGLLQAAGYAVSVLRDVPGLAVMRTVAMLANEAADAVNTGVCDVESTNVAMQLGVNYPRGPLAWAQDVGLAHVRDVLANLAAFYGEDRYRVSPWIQQTVLAGGKQHG